jgi:hypothetical protein
MRSGNLDSCDPPPARARSCVHRSGNVIWPVCRILGAGTRPLQGAVRVLRHDGVLSPDVFGRRVGPLAPQRRQDGLAHQPVMPSALGRDAGERPDGHRRKG